MRLKELRQSNQLSSKEIADRIACDQTLYERYEDETRALPVSVLIQLARVFGTSTDYILGLTDEIEPYPSGAGSPFFID